MGVTDGLFGLVSTLTKGDCGSTFCLSCLKKSNGEARVDGEVLTLGVRGLLGRISTVAVGEPSAVVDRKLIGLAIPGIAILG